MHRCEGAPSAFSVLIESEPRPYLFVLMRFHYANRQPPRNPSAGQAFARKRSSADDNYCSSGCECTGACGCALACDGGSVGTGLRIGVAIGRGGGVLGRNFCSEALAPRRAICSWLALSCSAATALSRAICACAALSCSAAAALSRTICSWLVLSCSIPCFTFARSRAIVCSHCASSGDIGAAVAATSC